MQDPLFALAGMAVNPSRFIHEQEAAGQRQLVNSDTIPIRGISDQLLSAMGFTLGEPVPGDKLFRFATLPAGWSKKPTDHDMWSNIVDDKGRERISVFYKAAFYDRDAFMRLNSRFIINGVLLPRDQWQSHFQSQVLDCGEAVFTSSLMAHPNPTHAQFKNTNDETLHRAYWDENDRLKAAVNAECEAWLNERYPNWKDPLAHWD